MAHGPSEDNCRAEMERLRDNVNEIGFNHDRRFNTVEDDVYELRYTVDFIRRDNEKLRRTIDEIKTASKKETDSLREEITKLTESQNESREQIQALLDYCFTDRSPWKEGIDNPKQSKVTQLITRDPSEITGYTDGGNLIL